AVLEDRFNEQEAKIRAAQSNAIWLQQDLKIPDSIASESGPSPSLSSETLRRVEDTRIESQFEFSRQATMLNLLRTLQKTNGNEKLAQVIQTAVPDGQLGSLLEQQNMAEQRFLTVQAEFGPEHAEVLKATDAVAD